MLVFVSCFTITILYKFKYQILVKSKEEYNVMCKVSFQNILFETENTAIKHLDFLNDTKSIYTL
ncbi:hypothetical protein DCS32_10640 [Dokdonia sp. Dokd-P16]|nr:hypothetical protein DCS32_10640 [Dokdonia sp. Dokd-P16]